MGFNHISVPGVFKVYTIDKKPWFHKHEFRVTIGQVALLLVDCVQVEQWMGGACEFMRG